MDALDKKVKLLEQNRAKLLESFYITWTELKEATLFVNDTLGLCQASAQESFGDNATPEVILAIYDRILQQVATARNPEY